MDRGVGPVPDWVDPKTPHDLVGAVPGKPQIGHPFRDRCRGGSGSEIENRLRHGSKSNGLPRSGLVHKPTLDV